MPKIRYEIDPHNRLVIIGLNKFRTVIDGEFELGPDHGLVYHVKKSDSIDIPQQIKFKGTWSLDKAHNLVFTFDKWNNQVQGNKLVLKSDLVSASGNELVFSVETKESAPSRVSSYLLKFGGIWQADKHNRLTFNVEKESGSADILTLQGIWAVNKQHEIIYSYTKALKGTKEKVENVIILRGHWDIAEKSRLVYTLNHDIGSELNFRVAFQEAEKNFLKYSIGIGAASRRRSVALFGTWKLDRDLGLMFEVEYEKGCVQEIMFGADCRWKDGYSLDFKLKNKLNEGLGIEIVLSKQIFKDQGEAFIRAMKSKGEVSIVAGVGIKW